MKLSGSELNVMEILWENGNSTAKKIAEILGEKKGWSKTTTYTIINRSVEKGTISRKDPDFVCHALVSREEAQDTMTTDLINKFYGGMTDRLMASLLERKGLSLKEIEKLEKTVKKLSGED